MHNNVSRRSLLIAAGAAATIATVTARSPARSQVNAASIKDKGLAYRNVNELRAMLDARQVSATELLEHAIKRIEAHDARINAVVVRDFDRARAAAGVADAALARGERKPLLGIPITVKESFNVGGLPTTWGLPMGQDWRPAEDAVAVARLKAAGGIILGKTNVPTGISDWQSYNAIYNTNNNPWDLQRTPGGSSGGAAATLAAGYVPLELGSDISGSLRVPAHFCGVFSHKPTSDLVPQRGHSPPRSPALQTDLTSGLGVCGPLARTARDLALALDVLAGPDEYQAGAYRLSLPPARHADLRSYRVLIVDTHPLLPVAAEICAALDQLARRLGSVGATVARSSGLLPDLVESARLHTRVVRNVVNFGRPPEYFQKMREGAAALSRDDDSLKAWRVRAPLLTHHEWIAADFARARLRQQWNMLFRDFDVVLCPPCSVVAFPHDHVEDQEDRRVDIDGTAHPYLSLIVWATLATPPGLPATVMPIGRSRGGLPIGVQIIGPLLEDRTTIAFAGLMEREFGGFVAPPLFP
jgi:amidase